VRGQSGNWLSYLDEGVVEWWLIHQRYLRGLNQVRAALEILVHRGVVKMERGGNGEFIYLYGRKNLKN
jgi:hypothetical protein